MTGGYGTFLGEDTGFLLILGCCGGGTLSIYAALPKLEFKICKEAAMCDCAFRTGLRCIVTSVMPEYEVWVSAKGRPIPLFYEAKIRFFTLCSPRGSNLKTLRMGC